MSIYAKQIEIHGQVQGVGFRPFVFNLANRLGIVGHVANGPEGVSIFAQGSSSQLTDLLESLQTAHEQPPMAEVHSLVATHAEAVSGLNAFEILKSAEGEVDLAVTPDAAVCQDCLEELFDPNDRRYLYPFINCTNCGPRYSLIKSLPYDRANTTMAPFTLCSPCDQEYKHPENRRFHAQPTACANCGPSMEFRGVDGNTDPDPIGAALALIQQGKIVAIKGIGGFHLVCDAQNPEAVQRLRDRKQRPEKPFAVMGANLESLRLITELNSAREERLKGHDAPICLCPKVEGTLPEAVAPKLNWLGVMLPHTPIHYLLFHRAAQQPTGTAWLKEQQTLTLVMTSANLSGNPLITQDEEALEQLAHIADGFLLHNRAIETRCDDSVISMVSSQASIVRNGRGLAPTRIKLPDSLKGLGKSVLAVGAFFKNTICLTKGDSAYVSQYIGDLDNPECCRNLNETVAHLSSLLDIKPDLVVADLHPDFYSSRFAREYAQANQIPLMQVQHHHAHVAAVACEHELDGDLLGVALDGLGLGNDGQLWGGELLKVSGHRSERIAHFSKLKMPGGDRAAREPWRIASAALHELNIESEQLTHLKENEGYAVVQQLLAKNLNCPETSSAGRLFDAVAALLDIKQRSDYEAHAAMLLESAAWQYLKNNPWPLEPPLLKTVGNELVVWPLLQRLTECEDKGYAAALFHRQLIDGLASWVTEAAEQLNLTTVALAGGCFLNQLLLSELQAVLAEKMQVLVAQQLSCNDGAISLGQAHIALQELAVEEKDNDKNRDDLCV